MGVGSGVDLARLPAWRLTTIRPSFRGRDHMSSSLLHTITLIPTSISLRHGQSQFVAMTRTRPSVVLGNSVASGGIRCRARSHAPRRPRVILMGWRARRYRAGHVSMARDKLQRAQYAALAEPSAAVNVGYDHRALPPLPLTNEKR